MGRGRTSRRRKRKAADNPVSREILPEWLMNQWICTNGFNKRDCHVAVKYFNGADTGRGLMALKCFKPGDVIISLPENLLITSGSILNRPSSVGPVLCSFRSFQQLSSYDILSTFLMYERHRGVQSPWHTYINTLPQTYSTPAYWSAESLSSLPSDVCQDAGLLMNKMTNNFTRLQDLFCHIEAVLGESVAGAFTFDSFRWAWTSVSTRCVYMRPANFTVGSSEDNCIALAPLLDLLNHSANVQVEAGFDEIKSCYSIRALTPCQKYSQIFINYGPHSNKHLLLNYGFVVDNNPHDVCTVTVDDICSAAANLASVSDRDTKLKLLQMQKLDKGLLFSDDGMSWNLKSALLLLCCDLKSTRLMDVYIQQNVTPEIDMMANSLAKLVIINMLNGIPAKQDVAAVVSSYELKLADAVCQRYRGILHRCLSALDSECVHS